MVMVGFRAKASPMPKPDILVRRAGAKLLLVHIVGAGWSEIPELFLRFAFLLLPYASVKSLLCLYSTVQWLVQVLLEIVVLDVVLLDWTHSLYRVSPLQLFAVAHCCHDRAQHNRVVNVRLSHILAL